MKALFLVDNVPAVDMLVPIATKLTSVAEVVFVRYGGLTGAVRLQVKLHIIELSMNCIASDKQLYRSDIDRLLEEEDPDIVVMTREEAAPEISLFLDQCIARGIPTLFVPHGIRVLNEAEVWGANDRFARLRILILLAKQGFRKLMKGHISIPQLVRVGIFRIRNDFKEKGILSRYDRFSMIAAYGDTMRDILIHENVSEENIVVTGSTKYDVYNDESGGNAPRGGVLLLTNYFVEAGLWSTKQRVKYVLDICSAVNTLSPHLLRIKIHPTVEDIKDYEDIKRKYNLPVELYQREPLAGLINDCDIAITTSSSAGLDAMIAGKPLVIFNPYKDVTAFTETSGASIAQDATELFAILQSLRENGVSEERKELAEKFVYQQSYLQDGKATDRIVDLIVEMAGG